MLYRKPLLVLTLAVTVGLTAALAFEPVYDIGIRPRPVDPLTTATGMTRGSRRPDRRLWCSTFAWPAA
jgi:hypothetical protein